MNILLAAAALLWAGVWAGIAWLIYPRPWEILGRGALVNRAKGMLLAAFWPVFVIYFVATAFIWAGREQDWGGW